MDIDLTSDLTGGADDAAFADTVPANQSSVNAVSGERPSAPEGTVHVNEIDPAAPKKDEFNLRDQLSNAFKGEDTPKPNATDTAAPKPYDGPALEKDSAGKWRTPDGTFASNEQVQAFEAAQAAAPPVTDTSDYTATISRMTPVEQEMFKSLPAEIQQFVGRTMENVNSEAARYAEYGLIEQVIGNRREAWAGNGMTPATAVQQLLALSDFATQRPKDFVLWFADQNQVDLDAALDERDAQGELDPALVSLQGQVQQLQTMLTQQGGQQQQSNPFIEEVNAFALEKDEGGALKRPYLTQVKDTWPTHISSVRSMNPSLSASEVLQKAYENACWANPTVRNTMQLEAQKAARATATEQAQRAKAAASSITGGPNGQGVAQTNANGNLSLRDELASQFAAARA